MKDLVHQPIYGSRGAVGLVGGDEPRGFAVPAVAF